MSEPTSFELERMALGEIPTPPEHEAAVAKLRDENRAILDDYPADDFLPRIREASSEGSAAAGHSVAPWITGGGLLLAAALAAVMLWPAEEASKRPLVPGTDGEVRLKGPEVRLQIWRSAADGEELLADGASVSTGDVLQPKFGVAAEPGYGVLFSIDGRGNTTLFFPEEGSQATRLEPGDLRATSFAYELDDAPDFETFHLVVCADAPDPQTVVERVTAGESPGDGCTLRSVELKKR